MADQVATQSERTTSPPGTVVKNRGRLWRVDAQVEDVLIATAIDTGEPEQLKSIFLFEENLPCELEPPRESGNAGVIGHPWLHAFSPSLIPFLRRAEGKRQGDIGRSGWFWRNMLHSKGSLGKDERGRWQSRSLPHPTGSVRNRCMGKERFRWR